MFDVKSVLSRAQLVTEGLVILLVSNWDKLVELGEVMGIKVA